MVPRRWIFSDFLRLLFSASRVQHISDLHSKFAIRPHHVWKYGRHQIYTTAENSRGKKIKEETTGRKYSVRICYTRYKKYGLGLGWMSGLGLVVNICHTSISATNHGLYSNASCSTSQWPMQWERAISRPQISETALSILMKFRPPEDHPPCRISFQSDYLGLLILLHNTALSLNNPKNFHIYFSTDKKTEMKRVQIMQSKA